MKILLLLSLVLVLFTQVKAQEVSFISNKASVFRTHSDSLNVNLREYDSNEYYITGEISKKITINDKKKYTGWNFKLGKCIDTHESNGKSAITYECTSQDFFEESNEMVISIVFFKNKVVGVVIQYEYNNITEIVIFHYENNSKAI